MAKSWSLASRSKRRHNYYAAYVGVVLILSIRFSLRLRIRLRWSQLYDFKMYSDTWAMTIPSFHNDNLWPLAVNESLSSFVRARKSRNILSTPIDRAGKQVFLFHTPLYSKLIRSNGYVNFPIRITTIVFRINHYSPESSVKKFHQSTNRTINQSNYDSIIVNKFIVLI